MPSERAASATICNFFAVFISGAFCLVVVVLPARRRPPWWAKRDGLSLTAGVQGLGPGRRETCKKNHDVPATTYSRCQQCCQPPRQSCLVVGLAGASVKSHSPQIVVSNQ